MSITKGLTSFSEEFSDYIILTGEEEPLRKCFKQDSDSLSFVT